MVNFFSQTEMMSDSIDDALDGDEAEEETEELTAQVSLFSTSLLTLAFSTCHHLPHSFELF